MLFKLDQIKTNRELSSNPTQIRRGSRLLFIFSYHAPRASAESLLLTRGIVFWATGDRYRRKTCWSIAVLSWIFRVDYLSCFRNDVGVDLNSQCSNITTEERQLRMPCEFPGVRSCNSFSAQNWYCSVDWSQLSQERARLSLNPVIMGLLTIATPMSWDEAKKHADYVREHGITQFINIYYRLKDRHNDSLKFGEEVCALSTGATAWLIFINEAPLSVSLWWNQPENVILFSDGWIEQTALQSEYSALFADSRLSSSSSTLTMRTRLRASTYACLKFCRFCFTKRSMPPLSMFQLTSTLAP